MRSKQGTTEADRSHLHVVAMGAGWRQLFRDFALFLVAWLIALGFGQIAQPDLALAIGHPGCTDQSEGAKDQPGPKPSGASSGFGPGDRCRDEAAGQADHQETDHVAHG